MKRVAIIGNAGGGKSSLARKLGNELDIQVYSVDKFQWKPGWVQVSQSEFNAWHEAILILDTWIIDGWGSPDHIRTRIKAADTIIFVDHPLYIHYWWAFKRQVKDVFGFYSDGPEGCPMLPKTWELVKMMWNIHKNVRPGMLKLFAEFKEQKRFIHIKSPKDLRTFHNTLHTM